MENNETKEKKQLNCAIYTRVSTTEGLEQQFTSLDNQREAAESYIQSQKSEGWTALPEHYDDAGFTGANTDRPALQKLVEDIKAHKINCVVVYKVDRLSRSLLDFSKLLEFFDQNNIAFVSVTQHFNTNTSMGRLTLNILLSFAQFEREIISERTKDKMAASKKKGKWVGGCVPLGYDIDRENRKLVINPEEAKIVREIFDAYLKERTLMAAVGVINDRGYVTKKYQSLGGKKRGGIKFQVTSINQIVKNVCYTGKVKHDGILYPGEQERIISDEVFTKAQELIAANRRVFFNKPKHNKISLLGHILRCKDCDAVMNIFYSEKRNGKCRYFHYVCLSAHKRGYKTCPTKLVNANLMDNKAMACLRSITDDPRINSEKWDVLGLDKKILIIRSIIKQVRYSGANEILEIQLQDDTVHQFKVLKQDLKQVSPLSKERLIKTEPQLRQNLLLAHQIQKLLFEGKSNSLKQIAGWLNISPQRINQLRNLVLLCPKIQENIFLGESSIISQIPEYKLRKITDTMGWQEQQNLWQKLLNTASEQSKHL
ncbi:MAG: recombinase family protein [Candidatus Omnitrophica bacterium]|nr:recombinase family protein [Candidatus Omnitrophota bacterium]